MPVPQSEYIIKKNTINNRMVSYAIYRADESEITQEEIDDVIIDELPQLYDSVWNDDNKYTIATLHDVGWRSGKMFKGDSTTSYFNSDSWNYDQEAGPIYGATLTVVS